MSRHRRRRASTPRSRRSRAAPTHLLALQHPDGWWKGELETNVTIDAEDLFAPPLPRHPRRREQTERDRALDPLEAARRRHAGRRSTAARPTSRPRSRPTSRCGSPATAPDAAHMRGAAAFVRDARRRRARRASSPASGCRCSRLWSWDDVPALPPELILLPAACAAQRSTSSAAGRGRRSSRSRSRRRSGRRRACRSGSTSCGRAPTTETPTDAVGRAFTRARPRPAPLRAPARSRRCGGARCARPSAGSSSARRRDGSWGGIQPPWVYSMIALHALGYRARPPGDRARRSPASTASRSRTTQAAGSRRASRRCGTRRSR